MSRSAFLVSPNFTSGTGFSLHSWVILLSDLCELSALCVNSESSLFKPPQSLPPHPHPPPPRAKPSAVPASASWSRQSPPQIPHPPRVTRQPHATPSPSARPSTSHRPKANIPTFRNIPAIRPTHYSYNP